MQDYDFDSLNLNHDITIDESDLICPCTLSTGI